MKVGLISIGIGSGTDAESIKTIATNAERLGFATLWAPEHVVLIEGYKSRYPYSAGGEVMGRLDSPLLDPWVGWATPRPLPNGFGWQPASAWYPITIHLLWPRRSPRLTI